MSGYESTPIERTAMAPNRTRRMAITHAKTGRSMKKLGTARLLGHARRGGRRVGALSGSDLGSRLAPVGIDGGMLGGCGGDGGAALDRHLRAQPGVVVGERERAAMQLRDGFHQAE